jgi:hypothetical protein
MDGTHHELAEMKGYVARIYQIIRSRTEMALQLTDEQDASTQSTAETIEDINTKLQIANIFQEEEIYKKLSDVEGLLKQLLDVVPESHKNSENLLKKLLDVVPETFTKVEEWMGMSFGTGSNGVGDKLAYVIEESEKSYHIKTLFEIQFWRGPGWVKRGYEPSLISADEDTIITVNKSRVLTYFKPAPERLEEFLNSEAYHANYNPVIDPWKEEKGVNKMQRLKHESENQKKIIKENFR